MDSEPVLNENEETPNIVFDINNQETPDIDFAAIEETPDINFQTDLHEVDIDDLDEPDQYMEPVDDDGDEDDETAATGISICSFIISHRYKNATVTTNS